jgi:predicted DNA-binding antitoxin AbrB/MazE fold protein
MSYDVEAIFDHGVFRPTEPLALPDGARVRLQIEEQNVSELVSETSTSPENVPSLFDRLSNVVGSIDDLPGDSSTNLDHYLYGQPKR